MKRKSQIKLKIIIMNYLKTTEKKAVENYPYGYTQKTTAFFSLDFNP
jgi:hypothetical protein